METKLPEQKEKKTVGKEMMEWVKSIAIALVAAMLIRTFLFSMVRVDGDSMLETLKDGDVMFVTMFDRYIGDFERGEVVICNYPNAKGYRVKRVIGLPGDTIETACSITRAKGPFHFAKGEVRVDGKLCVSAEFSFAVAGG